MITVGDNSTINTMLYCDKENYRLLWFTIDCRRDQIYRVQGRFIAYNDTKKTGICISRNKLRFGRDKSGPYGFYL